MKNKLLSFIDLLIFFFNQGYSLQETLDFCSLLNYEKEVRDRDNTIIGTIDYINQQNGAIDLFKRSFS